MSSLKTEVVPLSRPVLTRERVVAAGVELVDEGGPEALTMRAVAQRLGSGVMSLYRHVAGREELLDLVLAAMAADVPRTPPIGEWRADLAAAARDVRAGLLHRPHLTVLLTSRSGRGGAEVSMLERTLGILRSAGFSPEEAVLVNHALGNYVAGAALWEAVGMAGTAGPERRSRLEAAADTMAALPPERFPSLAWVGRSIIKGTLEERFEFGLRALIDGFEIALSAAPAVSSGRRSDLRNRRPAAHMRETPADEQVADDQDDARQDRERHPDGGDEQRDA
jgi:AcrR family transcriptional regulator